MLRDFQVQLVDDAYDAWRDDAVRNIIMVAPTGSGKTVVLGHIIKQWGVPACVIAHRQELIGQLALALNREQVAHAIIAPKDIIRQIVTLEMELHGKSYYSANASTRVAGVDTLVARETKERWFSQVQLVVIDEGHHVLRENKWGEALSYFPNARGLFPTAHAIRADGKGLGRAADGLADRLILGPSARELINRGFLTDYRLVCPPSDIDVSTVPIGSTGDFSAPQLRKAVHKSKTIVGDVVTHYRRFAEGKLGITFSVDIEAATEIATAYNKAQIPAAVITAKTPLHIRGQLMRRFRSRDLLQLVSVDVLGEGVDVPAIEVVSMVRHTQSFQIYAQQFGRALRLMVPAEKEAHWDSYTDAQRLQAIAASVKPKALIIDHVSNWKRHGLPDIPRTYSLLRRDKRSRGGPADAIPLRLCDSCLQPYERFRLTCPYCGETAVPARRSSPEFVDGDLHELDAAVLKALRGEIARIDSPPDLPEHVTGIVAASIHKNFRLRQLAQGVLRKSVALWGGYQKHLGLSDREAHKLFYLTYGVDVLTAQTLNAADAEALANRVNAHLTHVEAA